MQTVSDHLPMVDMRLKAEPNQIAFSDWLIAESGQERTTEKGSDPVIPGSVGTGFKAGRGSIPGAAFGQRPALAP